MDIYGLFGWTLVVILIVTGAWPVNIPLAALAFKIRLGDKPLPFATKPFWIRSTFAALGLCVLSFVMLGLAYIFTRGLTLPGGPVYVVLVIGYIPVGVWYMFWMFACEDLLDGLSIFLIYLLLPGLPLGVLGALMGFLPALAERLLPSAPT
jgi:hypothetical protein